MSAPDLSWATFLLSVAKSKTNEIQDWRELQRRFHVFVTKEISATHGFFCDGLEPHDPFPLDRYCVCATNKLVNQINHYLQQWRLGHSASYLLSPNSSNDYPISPDCLKLSKSISLRRLIHLTCLQVIYPFWKGIRSF
jgi:hypothetical protein